MEIQELKSEDEWCAAFSVMQELRFDLPEAEFLRLRKIMSHESYRLFAVHKENAFVALAGFAVLTNLVYGRHIWVYEQRMEYDKTSFVFLKFLQ